MKQPINKLPTFNLNNKRVILRADLNVPLSDNRIEDDFRIRALQPTLDYLIKNNAVVFIATHIGRPQGRFNSDLSTKLLLPWFKKNNYTIEFESDLKRAATGIYQPGSIILLENLRFFPGEENCDPIFAHELAALGDYYVNDAFGALHRNDCSLTLVPGCFPQEKKTIGFLIEKELHALKKLTTSPEEPFVCIIGGGKIETKIELIKNLLEKTQAILLCPAIVFTFLKALNKPVGKSLIDEQLIATAHEIITMDSSGNHKLRFPLDYQIADSTRNGPLSFVEAQQFPERGFGISIGPKTVAVWSTILNNAKTIFVNAAMGFSNRPETLEGLHALLKCVAASNAYSVIGGGDTAAAAERFGLSNKLDFISTGGGATLTYLSGKDLPGLNQLM